MKSDSLLRFLCILLPALPAYSLDVREFGASGNGVTKDTKAIQAAIDAASAKGGGVVSLPPGKYLVGTLTLKSFVTLDLHSGATLVASPDDKDFAAFEKLPFKPVDDEETTYFRRALLTGEGLRQVAVTGMGVIEWNRKARGGPKTIALKNCDTIAVRGITIRNAPNYAVSFLGSSHVEVDGVTIENGFSDGIDLDCSRFARISDCHIDSADDAICLKTSQALGAPRPTEDVTITNCILRTNANCFKMGTESRGDFRNIAVSNCVFVRRDTGRPPQAGIAIESVDGANLDGVVVSNITMRDVATPVFIRLGNRGRGMNPPVPGTLQNVSISNIIALGGLLASSITGLDGAPIQQVSLADINWTMAGGGEFKGLDVPEEPGKYPSASMFGELPAQALYARHVEGMTLRNIRTESEKPDKRPALVFDDVKDLDVSGFRFSPPAGPQPAVWFHRVAGALFSGTLVTRDMGLFLRVSGSESRHITLVGNDLHRVRTVFETANGADRSVVALAGNVVPSRAPAID